MQLIDNASSAWRMLSVQVGAVAVAWGSLPEQLQATLLDAVGVPAGRVPAILGALVILGRIISQPKLRNGP